MRARSTWQLPFRELEISRVEAAMKEALHHFDGALLGSLFEPDVDAFAGDFEAADGGAGPLRFTIGMPRRLLEAHQDAPSAPPDGDGLYWGSIQVQAGTGEGFAHVVLDPADPRTQAAQHTLRAIATELSSSLG